MNSSRIIWEKAKQYRTHEDLVTQIQSQILDGKLRPGDKLPSERQLGEAFGVSRGTLREALRVLEKKGLIWVKVGFGGGAFVRAADDAIMSEDLGILLRLQKITLEELLEFRESLEGTVAVKAAKNAKREDVAHLQSILDSMRAMLRTDDYEPADVVQLDINFHLYLAKISGNRLFPCILSTVWMNTRWYSDFIRDRTFQWKNYEDL
jgi:GntR family transcriptional repressor for pyruvate dehydrogenase complex